MSVCVCVWGGDHYPVFLQIPNNHSLRTIGLVAQGPSHKPCIYWDSTEPGSPLSWPGPQYELKAVIASHLFLVPFQNANRLGIFSPFILACQTCFIKGSFFLPF